MKLSEGKVGEAYRIKDIALDSKVKRRLEILGMTRDSSVNVLNSKKSGTKIIKIRGTRFAVGRDFTQNIEVEEVGGDI